MTLLHQLFPKVRAEMLRLLFGAAEPELHVRELERRSGLHVKTIQDELGKLAAADLVTSRRDGNRRYFRANARHPLHRELRQLVLKTAGLKDVLAQALAGVQGVELAVVFGSLAAGAGQAASDVDLLVVGDATLRALAPPLRAAGQALEREINPVTLTAAAFRRKGHPFVREVLAGPLLFVKGGPDELARLGKVRMAETARADA